LTALKNAVDWWTSPGICLDVVADLGDAIDGYRNETRDMGMHALENVMKEWNRLQNHTPRLPILHLIGNHELYKFTRTELETQVGDTGFTCASPPNLTNAVDRNNSIHYTFKLDGISSPWRIVVLDPYDESVMTNGGGRLGHELTVENGGVHTEFTALCQSHNPNDILSGGNFLEGMHGTDARWVPYNGGLGQAQLDWLEEVLSSACNLKEKVIILCHVVIHPEATPKSDCHALLWNYEAVLALLSKYDCVKLILSGHAHREGYYHCTSTGVHHLTIASPLEAPDDLVEETFGILEISDTHADLIGRGWVNSRRMMFFQN